MVTNLDDISQDDMKDTSEIGASNVGNQGTKLGAIHKRCLLRWGGRGSPLKADLLNKPI